AWRRGGRRAAQPRQQRRAARQRDVRAQRVQLRFADAQGGRARLRLGGRVAGEDGLAGAAGRSTARQRQLILLAIVVGPAQAGVFPRRREKLAAEAATE